MKSFTGGVLGADIGLLAYLSITTLMQILPAWWFGLWIVLIGILNIMAFMIEIDSRATR